MSVTAARESIDGTGIWYKREQSDGPLLFQPLAGDQARPIIPCVRNTHFSIGAGGVYYMPCAPAGEARHDVPVRLFNTATATDRLFTVLDDVAWPAAGRSGTCIVISPNGRTLLCSRTHTREADLIMIEHFR